MAVEHSINLVVAFLAAHSTDAAPFKKNRAVLLTVAGDLNITLSAADGFIYLTGILGKTPDNEALYYDLLKENLKSAGHSHYRYAIDAESDELLVALTVQSGAHQAESFIKLTDNFIAQCREWVDLLYAISLGVSADAGRAARYLPRPDSAPTLTPETYLKV